MKYLVLSLLFLTACDKYRCVEQSPPIKKIHRCNPTYQASCIIELEDGSILNTASEVVTGKPICTKLEKIKEK